MGGIAVTGRTLNEPWLTVAMIFPIAFFINQLVLYSLARFSVELIESVFSFSFSQSLVYT